MTAQDSPLRGRVYMADIGHGQKPFLIVSNNARNRSLDTYLAVRITTSQKPQLPSIVELGSADPLVGRALCDDIIVLYQEDLERDVGALSLQTLHRIGIGLRHALAL